VDILIGYASTHGSTRGIAERIGVRLGEHGLHAEVRSLNEVRNLERYGAAVLGSAIHDQAWLPEAAAFVRGNSEAISSRPVWLFSVGMTDALAAPLRARAQKAEEAKMAAEIGSGMPLRGHRLFSGVVQPDHLSGRGRFMFRAMGGRYGDLRNWDEIDAWTDEIARQLQRG
jgi:menaquinone-dependent protoporphyrinogen oxidase